MSIIASITTSVDGYVTGPDDGPKYGLGIGGERLHYWVMGGPWTYESEHEHRRQLGLRQGVPRRSHQRDEAAPSAGAACTTPPEPGVARTPSTAPLFVLTHRTGDASRPLDRVRVRRWSGRRDGPGEKRRRGEGHRRGRWGRRDPAVPSPPGTSTSSRSPPRRSCWVAARGSSTASRPDLDLEIVRVYTSDLRHARALPGRTMSSYGPTRRRRRGERRHARGRALRRRGGTARLLAGGTTMLSWPDTLCEALARGGHHVVRYDLRDSGASTTVDPEAPAYTLRDLAADAAALARELNDRPVHLAGIGVGGMVAQVAALDHPDTFSALTLVGTRPVAPGPVDDDLPDHDTARMERLFYRGRCPSSQTAPRVAEFAAGGAGILGNDPAATPHVDRRAHVGPYAGHRAHGAEVANQLGMVFAKLDCQARAGAGACPSSRSRRWWCTVAAIRSSLSATAKRPRAESARCAAAGARTGRDGDPRCGRR